MNILSLAQVNITDNSNDSINGSTPIGTLFPEIPITQLVGTINDFDAVDFYRLTIDTPLTSGIALQNLTDNLDVAVLDSNGNLIASGNNLGASNEAFQANFSTPGEYFINVFQTFPGIASDYQLALFPRSVDPNVNPNVNPIDNSNDNINTPTFAGPLPPETPISISGTINDFDRLDYYSIIVEQPLNAGVALQNLTGNLDVAILDSNRNLIARGDNQGASNEAFQAAFSTPGEYLINVYQTAPGIASNYELALFPAGDPNPQTVNISIDGTIDGTDEAVRNRENTAFVFKEDYLLDATANTPVTIDLISINDGFDPLLEVYQIPQDSLLESGQGQIIAANDNGGNDINNVNARIGLGAVSDIPGVSSELTLSPEFDYLLRVTYTELPFIGGFTLDAGVDNGFVSLTRVLLGNPIGETVIGGDPSINGLF